MALFWIAFFVSNLKMPILTRLSNLVRVAFVVIGAFLLLFGFHLRVLLERIWVWIIGNISHPQNSTDVFHFHVKTFGQFSSKIGIPLFFGLIKYPYTGNFGTIHFLVWLFLSASFVFLVYKGFLAIPYGGFRNSVLIFVLSFGTISLVSYVIGNSYLVLKFSTWSMPLISLIALQGIISLLIRYSGKFYDVRNLLVSLIALALLFVSFSSASQYLLNMKKWDSFTNVPNPSSYGKIMSFKKSDLNHLFLIMPTAEDAIWTAGLFSNLDQNRILSIGPTKQALAEGFSSVCDMNRSVVIGSKGDYIGINLNTIDVVHPVTFNSNPILVTNNLALYNVENLNEGLVLTGDGLYPPSYLKKLGNHVLSNGVMRWSSGQVCTSVFSNKAKKITVRLNFANGPDSGSLHSWQAILNGTKQIVTTESDSVTVSVSVLKGWNKLQLKDSSCYFNNYSFSSRWSNRADDRKLCFAVTNLSLSDA
jgi:hypothetical protein